MLEIHLPSFIATVVIFLGLIAYLNAKLYKPLLSFMDDRENSIQKDEKEAEQNLAKTTQAHDEIDEILEKARMESAKIKEDALTSVREKSAKRIADKKEEFELSFEEYLKNLEKQKIELKNELKSKIPEIKSVFKDSLAKI
ncbi:MAG: F0F1 ATP synthase subunit B' [Campylobacter sp.]|nr:F0F1 ATP synthase subunit B' [Campylobacter sp.]